MRTTAENKWTAMQTGINAIQAFIVAVVSISDGCPQTARTDDPDSTAFALSIYPDSIKETSGRTRNPAIQGDYIKFVWKVSQSGAAAE